MLPSFERKMSVQGTSSPVNDKISMKEEDKVIVSTDEEVTTVASSSKSNQISNDSPWQDPTYFSSFGKELMFIGTCMLAQLLNQAGQTHALCIMNVLSKSFGSESNNQAWLMASFPLAAGSFILISGRLGDIYGLKKMLMIGYVIIIVWSIISGLSKYSNNDSFFITCRAFQGVGIAFILPNIMGLVGHVYKVGSLRKSLVISVIGACGPTGALFGGVFGGLIVIEDPNQWPWVFYAFGIATFISMLMAWYSIPNNVPTNVHGLSMDWTGSVLAVIGLILFNFVWNEAPIAGWDKAYIIVLLVVSVFFLVAFFVYEIKYAEVPLLPHAVTKNRHMIMILLAVFVGWGSFGIWTFYYVSFQLNLRHYSPVWTGGTYFVFAIFGTIAAFFVAFSIKRLGPALLLCFALMAFDAGSIMFSVLPVEQSYWKLNFAMQAVLCFGMDLSFPASSIILSDGLPMQYQGMAGSLVNTVINYSASLCLGMGATVEHQINKSGKNVLEGYRAAVYLGIGLASLGVLISVTYMLETVWNERKKCQRKSLEA
ncbi:YMR279C-like protein [Saccharomyces kudriavzevii IFO 1802]|uniref:YMR279C-like protein n=1 Tax=Saccharomyces kudriavzevii (strain ATCC MYA-4449 / AS 2.2408 / CBS 8840 / NBRC 1802 / NCYC 2889) TaxID=226230 RepID=J6EHR0_SACK1|nr:YMR279C-like protein [Saccharomyces kudriavzevii IFO 1802]